MKINSVQYLPRPFALNAMLAFMIALGICSVLFKNVLLPWLWVLFAFIEVFGFFYFVNQTGRSWASISSKRLIRKLFWVSLFLRVIWVVFSYYFFIAQTGEPFDWVMADSWGYHTWALEASDSFSEKGFAQFFESGIGYSDLGYPMYLTAVYLIFGKSIIIARLLFAFFSAWTCVLIYKLAKRNFGEVSGRIAGIMAVLLPNFIYYTGLHLKETLMVFLIVAFMERADYLLRSNKISAPYLLILGLLAASLFFLRTVLGLSAIFALFSALMLSKKIAKTWLNRMVVLFWFSIIIWFFASAEIQGEINYFYQQQYQQEASMEYRAKREGGNAFATYGTAAVFLPVILVAPFPTMVNIDYQKQQMLLSGAYFVRNIYAFFVILALILMLKRKKWRNHILILSFIAAYCFILAKSSFAISERFHLPIVPFLLILAAFGITQLNKSNKVFFIPYVILIVMIIIGWNWFKLAGRGMF